VARDLVAEGLFTGAAALARGVLGLERQRVGGASALSARLHGLYWLTANLAERQPLVLAVDDAHWSDPASARFLDYLANRLADLPVIPAVAVRTGDAGARERLSVLRAKPTAVVLEPAPLSLAGSEVLLATLLGRTAEPGFAAACRAATGGNPYLLRELGAELARDRIAPLARSASPTCSSSDKLRRRAALGSRPASSTGKSTFSAAVSSSIRWKAWNTKPTA
jgi:predicted ATPase